MKDGLMEEDELREKIEILASMGEGFRAFDVEDPDNFSDEGDG
jgi:hypothetical protein